MLLNGVETAWRERYERWHAIEHVPERLSVPGMVCAARYEETQSQQPDSRRYLTVYDLSSLHMLESSAYQTLLHTPSPASQVMRNQMLDVRRLTAHVHEKTGSSIPGNWLLMLEMIDGCARRTRWPWNETHWSTTKGLSSVQVRVLRGQSTAPHPSFSSGEPMPDLLCVSSHDLELAQTWFDRCVNAVNSSISTDRTEHRLEKYEQVRSPKVSRWRLVNRYPLGTPADAEFRRPRPLFTASIQPTGDNHESFSAYPH